MKIIIVVSVYFISISFADVPLSNTPSWTSNDNDYSTGGALYDVTLDGWIDYCTGNGNDMASNKNAIYVNHNGSLETIATWRSDESGYFSHIYIGDVDNDSFPDMAVAYLGFGSPNVGPTRIYRNGGTGLNTTAWWISSDEYNSFDCAFGDVDLDGDLDLAVAAGDAYSGFQSPTRVYINSSGLMETTPSWTSVDSSPGNACRWIDVDNDGFLDLIVGYRHEIALFKNIGGTLEDSASWSASELGWILRIAVGDYNNDGFKDVAVACNGQLVGDSSRIEVYTNQSGVLQTPPDFVMLKSTDYCSCVEWGDVNNDGWIDLAAGGWWEPVVVFENNAGTLDTIPTWSWNGGGNLVCETVMWGDVRNCALVTTSDYKSGDGTRKLFYFDHHPIQRFHEVLVNDTLIPPTDFTYDPLTGWISFKDAPSTGSDNIEITYTYSQYPDLGVINWTSNIGNYLFHNTATMIAEDDTKQPTVPGVSLLISPNPFSLKTRITLSTEHALSLQPGATSVSSLKIYDVTGRLVKDFSRLTPNALRSTLVIWDGSDNVGRKLPNGIYLVEFNNGSTKVYNKVVIIN
jgi:hypothetical protein